MGSPKSHVYNHQKKLIINMRAHILINIFPKMCLKALLENKMIFDTNLKIKTDNNIDD